MKIGLFKSSILLAASLLFATPVTYAQSLPSGASTAVYAGQVYTSTAGASYQENIIGSTVYQYVVQAQQTVMNATRSSITSGLMSYMESAPGYQQGSGSVTVNGPFTLTINNGVVTISGLQVSAAATLQLSQDGVTASCAVKLSTNSATTSITGAIDPTTGNLVVSANGVSNFTVTPTYSCSTSIDWIPGVGALVNYAVNYFAGDLLNQAIQGAYNSLGGVAEIASINLYGLGQIPNGVLVYGGVDYGAQLKAQLPGALQAINMSVTIGDPKHYITGARGYPAVASSTDTILAFSVGGYNFVLLDYRTYDNDVYCADTANQPYCFFY